MRRFSLALSLLTILSGAARAGNFPCVALLGSESNLESSAIEFYARLLVLYRENAEPGKLSDSWLKDLLDRETYFDLPFAGVAAQGARENIQALGSSEYASRPGIRDGVKAYLKKERGEALESAREVERAVEETREVTPLRKVLTGSRFSASSRFNSDGTNLLSAERAGGFGMSEYFGNTIRLYDTRSSKEIRQYGPFAFSPTTIEVNPDFTRALASNGTGDEAVIVDLETGKWKECETSFEELMNPRLIDWARFDRIPGVRPVPGPAKDWEVVSNGYLVLRDGRSKDVVANFKVLAGNPYWVDEASQRILTVQNGALERIAWIREPSGNVTLDRVKLSEGANRFMEKWSVDWVNDRALLHWNRGGFEFIDLASNRIITKIELDPDVREVLDVRVDASRERMVIEATDKATHFVEYWDLATGHRIAKFATSELADVTADFQKAAIRPYGKLEIHIIDLPGIERMGVKDWETLLEAQTR